MVQAANVVRLPTAARRKVQQPTNRAGREARRAYRQENPWPGEYIHQQRREALKRAEIIMGIEQTPALLIVTAIVATLDDDARRKIVEQLATGAAMGKRAHVQAIEAIRSTRMTVGEQVDLDFAFRRLNGEATR